MGLTTQASDFASPDADVIGNDERELVSKDDMISAPRSAIVQVIGVKYGENVNLFKYCSGSLISPNHVLTAAHCLFDVKTNENYFENGYKFIVIPARYGYDNSKLDTSVAPFGARHAIAYRVTDKFKIDISQENIDYPLGDDYALLFLNAPFSSLLGQLTPTVIPSPQVLTGDYSMTGSNLRLVFRKRKA